jgi:carbon storage regulator
MLVLTRRPGQSIIIGDGVEIRVLSVAGEKVRIGVTAPQDVGIFRNEVYQRISEEREDEARDGEREDEDSEPAGVGRFTPGGQISAD